MIVSVVDQRVPVGREARTARAGGYRYANKEHTAVDTHRLNKFMAIQMPRNMIPSTIMIGNMSSGFVWAPMMTVCLLD